MHALLWPDEIRTTEGVAPDTGVTVRDKELDLADALMDTLGEVDLASLHDDYREAVEELIAAKASGEEPPAAPAPETGGKVLDLMAALENSVRAAKESRGEDVAAVTPMRTPKEPAGKKSTATAKKSAPSAASAKKSTAKSSQGTRSAQAAKKTTAKKSTAKKSATAKSTAKKTPAKKTTPRKRPA
jgi:DNA end-binding protein Ku